MLSEIAPEEFAAALDATAEAILAEAGWETTPIDALAIARRLGMDVAYDTRQAGRARLVHLHSAVTSAQGSILLRPEPRPERVQWAVAHELGEKFAERVFRSLGVDPREAPWGSRETVANYLAGRLLLPGERFLRDALTCGWDLAELKSTYATASHELIARRMLDFEPWVVITIYDNDRQTFRRSNRYRRHPELSPGEIECRRLVAGAGSAQRVEGPDYRVQGWPIYEAGWKREILRAERDEPDVFSA